MPQVGTEVIPEVAVTEIAVVQGVALGGLFDPQAEGSLTPEERSLISGLLANNAQVEVAIPDDISSEDLWRTLEACCKVGARVDRVRTVLKMLVGRALVLLENRPEMFKSRGFMTLASFMASGADNALPALTGISRAGLYEAMKLAEAFPRMPVTEMAAIGVGKLKLIAEIRKSGDSDMQDWIDKAKTGTAEKLREEIYRSNNGITSGSLELDTMIVTLTKAEKQIIEEFLKDTSFQAYCGTAKPGPMLIRCIEESSVEWGVQIREQQESADRG